MIGKTIWVYDINLRHYRRDEKGRSYGPPIWRKSWRPNEVVGENRVSWIFASGAKVPKKGAVGVAFSEEEIDRLAFVEENKHRISDAVSCLGYERLKQVADLIGYQPL
jgi:hypothetical protein